MINIAFAGNPNVGKTALINAIAKSDLKVGNWPGVTVEKKEVIFKYKNETIHLIDLPGTYTLSPYTLEEKITRNEICSGGIDGIINVIDATNLKRNLYLTLELMDLELPMVIALNMFDEFKKRGYEIDLEKFQNILGIDIIPTIASRNLGTSALIEKAYFSVKNQKIPQKISCQEHIEKEIEFLINKLKFQNCKFKRFLAVKLLENNEYAINQIKDENILNFAKEARERLKNHLKMDVKEFIIQDRYQKIDSIINKVLKKPLIDKVLLSDKLDKVFLNKYLGIPIFLIVMYFMFKFTFDGSMPFVNYMSDFFENYLGDGIKFYMQNTPGWLTSLLVDGVISGVGLVLSFLPLLVFLYFFMALLEESGYMARVSFLLDKLASKFGVKGNAFISLIIGFGCNVPAVYSTRTMSSMRERIILALMIPFMSCSARLPIYALFTSLFFKSHQVFIILSLYILGITVAFIVGIIANKILPKSEIKPFILELPTYHFPTIRGIWNLMWPNIKDFLVRAGSIIVLASVILWGLINLPPKSTPQTSYLAEASKEIAPVFKPVGFGEHWEFVAALIPGTLAKEVVISSLGTIYGVEEKSGKINKFNLKEKTVNEIKELFIATKESFSNLLNLNIKTLQSENFSSTLKEKIQNQFSSAKAVLSLSLIHI
jgi:ferrous iron transport protein B